MKKKLLLSFAVFATALSVNAQKQFIEKEDFSTPMRLIEESSKRTGLSDGCYYYYENNSRVTKNLNDYLKVNPVTVQTGATTFAPLKFDTMSLYSYKVLPKMNGSTPYWPILVQGMPFNAPVKLNKIRFLGKSNTTSTTTPSSNITVKVYDKKMANVLATKVLNVNTTYGYKDVVFDSPVMTSDTVLVVFQMTTAADIFQVSYSHNYFNNLKLKSTFTGDTTGQTKITAFKHSLPFNGDAAILAAGVDNGAVLGQIKTGFDFFFIPNFTYEIKADFSASKSTICLGEKVNVSNNSNTSHLFNPILNYYHWDFLANGNASPYTMYDFGGDISYSDKLSSEFTFSTPGDKRVVSKLLFGSWSTSPYAFEDSTVLNVTVSKVSAEALVSSAIKCNGGDAEVTVSATGGTAAYTGTGVKLAVKAGNASYDVTDANGCKGTATINVSEPTKLAATALVSSAIKCNGGDAEVTVSATGGTAAYTGTGVKQAVKAGNASYDVTDANGCKETATINVTEPTTLTVVASEVSKASNDNTKDGKAKVVATGGTSPYTYVWSANAGSTSEVTVGKGNYSVVVTDNNGCVKDGAVVITAGTASISELAIEGLSIYPNPTSTNLTVAFSSKGSASIELVNVAGQVVDTKNTTGVSNTSFDMTSLETGVYFVNIKVAEGTAIFKVVKD